MRVRARVREHRAAPGRTRWRPTVETNAAERDPSRESANTRATADPHARKDRTPPAGRTRDAPGDDRVYAFMIRGWRVWVTLACTPIWMLSRAAIADTTCPVGTHDCGDNTCAPDGGTCCAPAGFPGRYCPDGRACLTDGTCDELGSTTGPDNCSGGTFTIASCGGDVCSCASPCSADEQCVSDCCTDGFCAAACVCQSGGDIGYGCDQWSDEASGGDPRMIRDTTGCAFADPSSRRHCDWPPIALLIAVGAFVAARRASA